ncbi:AraC family transcriptional regulator [Pseudozobellia thermophila]|uniref:Transcriptional regulator, AraC family n=1 Tax=Pseudozobellia thermophila TaxID=192903 RepID=A0A1M6F586_9FLAO|nr:helix-turn-helix transcriptional regulator [Pseudozobellia thermophila]SHI92833.1 transcriptional regulator, AraC family [Pseudozobellia thermophila]
MNQIPDISFQGKDDATDIEFLKVSELFERIKDHPTHDPRQPHRISFFALLFITEGWGRHLIDLKTFTLKKGCVLKIAKGQVHAFQGPLDYDGYLVIFTEDFVLKYFSKSSIDSISHLYNYHISEPLVAKCPFNETFIKESEQELATGTSDTQKNIVAKLLELYLLRLERLSQSYVSVPTNKKHYPLFFLFKTLVEKNYKEMRNVKDYAETMSITPKHLNHIVQTFTLNTAKSFIDQYVVLELKRTMLSTDLSIKEIAYTHGFDEVTNFTKFFKKHTNLTPKQYKMGL